VLRVAVIQGGPSAEAEVSRASASAVASALRSAGHVAETVELGPSLARDLELLKCDVAFPLAHGSVGEDGTLAGFLEVLGIPYVGSGVLASALAMHKGRARSVFQEAGLPVAKGFAASNREDRSTIYERAVSEIGERFIVKPASSGSALGVSRILVREVGKGAVLAAFEKAWEASDALIVEDWIDGREITCGVLDGEVQQLALGHRVTSSPFAFSPTEIVAPNDPFYTFEARYGAGRSVHCCPAPLARTTTLRVQEIAVRAHEALGCRDLSRADFIVAESGEKAQIVLLEVNTLPGFTATSLYPEAAGVAGIPLPALVSSLVANAQRRNGQLIRRVGVPLPA